MSMNHRISRTALNVTLALGATVGLIVVLLLASAGLEILLDLPIGTFSHQASTMLGVGLVLTAGALLSGIVHILVDRWSGDA